MADNKDKKVLNVPALRFPEFTEEWIIQPIKEIADFIGGGTPSSTNETYWQGTIPWVSSSDIVEDNIDDITISRYITEEAISNSATKLCPAPVILIVSRVGVGKIALSRKAICTSQDFCNLINIKTNPTFLAYSLSRIMKRKSIEAQGTSIKGITSLEIQKIILRIPCLKEQNRIADLLQLIDKRIATQNKIIDKLQSLIKGLVDSILENPSWEKVYLCSFMQFYSTNSLSWEQLSYSNGNVRNLHYGLIHGFQTSMIDSTLLPRILPNYLPKQYTVCQDGDVVFTDASEDTNEIGKAIELSNTINVKTVCGLHTIHGRDIKQNTIVGFKGFAFNSRYFHDQVRRLAQGTKVYSITAKNLSSCYVYIPDMIKQENIVRLLNAYEENLSLNRTLLNKYEIQKQYLLQQMLI